MVAQRGLTFLRWTGIVIAALIVLVILVLAFMDWNLLKHPIERIASTSSGRSVTISGPLQVHVWSSKPSADLSGLVLGNPPWEAARPMLKVDKVHVEFKWLPLFVGRLILPRVEIDHPQVYLHRDKEGRANWTFESKKPTNEKAAPPPRIPAIRDFLIQNGDLEVLDEILHLTVNGTVQAHEHGSKDDPKAFRVDGHGTLNKEPFKMLVLGGPLVNLDPDRPYPFDLSIEAGKLQLASNGRFRKPFDFGQIDLRVKMSGTDLADFYYLTQLAMPNTPPFTLEAAVDRHENQFKVTDLQGTVGGSDIRGALQVDMSRKRANITGNIDSKQLRLRDLAASLGTQANDNANLSKGAPGKKKPPPNPNARLFPDSHLQIERVRAMDGDVRFDADAIEAGSLPLKRVALHIKLDQGVLSLDPFEFEMPQGRLHGVARIDAQGKVPQTHLDVRLTNIQLGQLKGKAPNATPPLGGVMQARAVLDGSGDSVHSMLADSNGELTAILPHGEIRSAFAELTGINVAKGLGLLLTGNENKADIRCGVAQFAVKDGDMKAQTLLFDTQNVEISGKGDIRLGPEELALTIQGNPKKPRIGRLKTPIRIGGHLKAPSIGVDTGKTVAQGAVAAALGTLVTPIAAVLAFVDPGLAKDANCSQLIETAKRDSGGTAPKTPSEPQKDPSGGKAER
jgi:AsmA family protein